MHRRRYARARAASAVSTSAALDNTSALILPPLPIVLALVPGAHAAAPDHRRSGRLDEALDEANAKGWIVVDMGRDWHSVFPEAGGRQASEGVQP
jgi:hypothetical protein